MMLERLRLVSKFRQAYGIWRPRNGGLQKCCHGSERRDKQDTMTLALGQVVWIAVKPVIRIYFIVGTGFVLARFNILSVEATRAVSDIVITALMPMLAFSKIVQNIGISDIKNVGIICLTSFLLFGAGLAAAMGVRRVLPVPRKWQGGILAGGLFPNINDLPIVYLQSMDQGLVFTPEEVSKGVANVIIFVAMFLVCLFNLGGFRLIEGDFTYEDEESESGREEKSELAEAAARPASADELESIPTRDSANTLPTGGERSEGGVRPLVPVQLAGPPLSMWNTRLSSVSSFRRRDSITSTMRSIDLRSMPPQGIADLIREYSNVDQFGKRLSMQEAAHGAAPYGEVGSHMTPAATQRSLTRIITSEAAVHKEDIEASGSTLPPWLRRFPLTKHVVFFLKNCLRPCSISVMLALVIAFIPWVKALFVKVPDGPHIPDAPDKLPPLSFLLEFTSYIGAASVPFGLMLLGATLGRLRFGNLPPGFWKAALVLVLIRLIILPIIGILWSEALVRFKWVNWGDDKMLLFVIVLSWSLPTMTSIIYFTATYTPINALDTTQMDCASFFLMLQYPVLTVSLPFVVTYFLKVKLDV
ncbi:ACL080Wp [Eremothecium gossypii ATCC 10895]|uniref:ACL080Wp n=1 Tax=Eremothecium gossypii (strain ATCC 10895 / CBS 109.51 / FGSC 9923 / NRRL Y-1056) TaxID=284811 RepID=Q75CJ9_EREGS|nr:ACL080Wp [Eremothecium gossypii ATCC 10895]AAS51148.2 ACL080Wp [Eremothecium gossypii ATCC 10895]